jgi:hypothetical protein
MHNGTEGNMAATQTKHWHCCVAQRVTENTWPNGEYIGSHFLQVERLKEAYWISHFERTERMNKLKVIYITMAALLHSKARSAVLILPKQNGIFVSVPL